ncbi:hypothetical protein CGC58_07435 [Capnocytophaga stomatis]|uniref:Uncharacterized protein n=1 Tax=Capnocytophaga stomatis TaxID=1848904 RepID=A0A250G001_9FLAO|nr:hypothetical protein CGC58_07435 [Capnocytophaga stomatis]
MNFWKLCFQAKYGSKKDVFLYLIISKLFHLTFFNTKILSETIVRIKKYSTFAIAKQKKIFLLSSVG